MSSLGIYGKIKGKDKYIKVYTYDQGMIMYDIFSDVLGIPYKFTPLGGNIAKYKKLSLTDLDKLTDYVKEKLSDYYLEHNNLEVNNKGNLEVIENMLVVKKQIVKFTELLGCVKTLKLMIYSIDWFNDDDNFEGFYYNKY